ncbi:Fic/DOC family protein [Stieleria varia]|uniref:Fic/DOC family protein n=2 Tax=Stieleria varia TaxID=2528005 RepID=A0A5C6A296_9BACT|nr:Fic/DOC family protein [Stieleria varia]
MMDIPHLDDLAFNQITAELIADANMLAEQVNERRPLPSDVIANIQAELLGERVFNSNAIEGNTLTLRETKSILSTGSIIDVGRKREATEALNLGTAINQVQDLVAKREAWSLLDSLTSVHETLMTDVLDQGAGRIRSDRVMITGAKHQPPRPEKLDFLLEKFLKLLEESSEAEPITLATWTHWGIARLHPFMDGNGRMARLWQDLVLFGGKLSAAVIRQEDRSEYYASLTSADDGDFNSLTQLVTRSLNRTLQIYVNAQREVDELKDWAVSIIGETNARVDEKRRLEYLRWVRQMEQVKDAFQRCATQLTNASDGSVEVQVNGFDILDQPTWETLRSSGSASKTWYFWVNFRQGKERVQFCFFFGRHWYSDADRQVDGIGPNACLLISEQRGDEPAVRISELPNCPITLREVLVVNDRVARKRFDVGDESDVYDLNVDPLQIARDFMQEVFLRRLT